MEVKRLDLLSVLRETMPRVDDQAGLPQSSCFVFRGDSLLTFDGEIACRVPSPVQGVEGAVPSKPLVELLSRLDSDDLEVSASDSELLIQSGSRRAGIRMESEILLPVDDVEEPGDWRPLSAAFFEAIKAVAPCAAGEETGLVLSCIHVTSEYIEACDDYRLMRYPFHLGTNGDFLIRRGVADRLFGIELNEWCQTENWVHFRHDTRQLVISCRRYAERYPRLDDLLEIEGEEVGLPQELSAAVDRANLFTKPVAESDDVTVALSAGTVEIEGVGPDGWYRESRDCSYSGQPIRFAIPPATLKELLKFSTKCWLTEDRLQAKTDRFTFVCCVERRDNGSA